MAHRLDQSTRAISRVGYRARFSPSGFSISSNIQSRQKKRSCCLGTGRALFTHKEPGGHCFRSREPCWHNLPPTSQQSQNVTLGWNFHGAPENILLPRKWNIAPFKPRGGESSPSTKMANNLTVHTSELQQAR